MIYEGSDPYESWFASQDPLGPELTPEQIKRMQAERQLGWYLNRPLMGRNVAGQEGGREFGNLIREGRSVPGAFVGSMPAYAQGWKQGFMGEVPDVTGADLFQAQDKSLWPELPESPAGAYGVPPGYEGGWSPSAAGGAGFLLDMMDPALAAAPGEAALGKMGAGLAGRYGMWEMAMRHPETFGKGYQPIRDLLRLPRKTEIPTGMAGMYENVSELMPQASLQAGKLKPWRGQSHNLQMIKPKSPAERFKYPTVIHGPQEEVTNLHKNILDQLGVDTSTEGSVRGFFHPLYDPKTKKWLEDVDVTATSKLGRKKAPEDVKGTFEHERMHGVTRRAQAYPGLKIPQELRQEVDDLLRPIIKKVYGREPGPTENLSSLIDDALYDYGYARHHAAQDLIKDYPNYKDLSTVKMGDELLAQKVGKQGPEQTSLLLGEYMRDPRLKPGELKSHQIIKELVDAMPSSIHPSLRDWSQGIPFNIGAAAATKAWPIDPDMDELGMLLNNPKAIDKILENPRQSEQAMSEIIRGMREKPLKPSPLIATASGKKYPEAFLHRTMSPWGKELDFLDYLMKAGKKSDVATNLITPTHTPYFRAFTEEPGLLFNVFDPENIKKASIADIGSGILRRNPDLTREIDFYKLRPNTLIDMKSEDPIKDLFSGQLERLKLQRVNDIMSGRSEIPRPWRLINELHYKMGDPSELAGVRLGKDTGKEYSQVFKDFSKRHNLPLFDFQHQKSYDEVIRGLEEYLTPGGRQYGWEKSFEGSHLPGIIKSTYQHPSQSKANIEKYLKGTYPAIFKNLQDSIQKGNLSPDLIKAAMSRKEISNIPGAKGRAKLLEDLIKTRSK